MNLQQLEYIVALDKTRHFVKAAEQCHVTQPTLSAMVQKLEEELGCPIFDRSVHPIVPTELGAKLIQQAQQILFQVNQLKETVWNEKEGLTGSLSLGMIPTVAPYLLPDFLTLFPQSYQQVTVKIAEMRTETIIEKLHQGELDMAILATPLDDPKILEVPLYYEKFIAYISPKESIFSQEEISMQEVSMEHIWVLEEGHCLRNQVLTICENRLQSSVYEAGSIDTLVKIVDRNGGYTIIPELHVELLSENQKKNLRKIVRPEAVREISLVIRNDYMREKMMNAVADCVKKIIPSSMIDQRLKRFAIKL